MVSGGMGLISYRGVLTVQVGDEGLRLAIFFLLAVGTPPLTIPWSAITLYPRDRLLWADRLRLRIDGGTELTLYGPAARLVDEFCARRFAHPEARALDGFAGG